MAVSAAGDPDGEPGGAVSPDIVSGSFDRRRGVQLQYGVPDRPCSIHRRCCDIEQFQRWASVPASVMVAAGATSAKFNITTSNVSALTTVTISAAYGGVSKPATLALNPVALSTLTFSPAALTGGAGIHFQYGVPDRPCSIHRRSCDIEQFQRCG